MSINGFAIHAPGLGKGIENGQRGRFLCEPLWFFVSSVLKSSEVNTENTEKSHRAHRELRSSRAGVGKRTGDFAAIFYAGGPRSSESNSKVEWWRGGELNSLRRPFQGRALPVSYPATVAVKDFTGTLQGCQCSRGWKLETRGWRSYASRGCSLQLLNSGD